VSVFTAAWLRVFFLFAPFSRFISGLVSLVRASFFIIYLILPHYLALRRNRSSARYFHWHSWCESRNCALWLTTDPSWHFTRAVYRSVTFGHLLIFYIDHVHHYRRFLFRQHGRNLLGVGRDYRFHESGHRVPCLRSCLAIWFYHRVIHLIHRSYYLDQSARQTPYRWNILKSRQCIP
jgi:hypothetical protein